MNTRLLTADDIIRTVETMIRDEGIEAFRTNGRIQLYSGPTKFITKAINQFGDNRTKAINQSIRQQSTMIDHTKVGRFLGRYKGSIIYTFFIEHYTKTHGPNSVEARIQADKVMRAASRYFIKASFGHVATAVCGAGRDRIFFQEELPELVDNQHIETINDIEADRIRHLFRNAGHYAAFRKICQAEVFLAYRHAQQSDEKEKPMAWKDYQTRRQFFLIERRATIGQMRALKQAEEYLVATSEFIYGDSPTHPSYVPHIKIGSTRPH